MSIFKFVARHWRFLGFGFLLTFSCNLGRTFFIGLYSSDIRADYGLSNGDFGALYGAATLFSAAMLIWIGRLVDRIDLRIYTLCVIITMALACMLMYLGTSVLYLGIALALLRLSGQGLMPHISKTSMGRYFESARGRAVSIAHLGINAGQITLPLIAAILIAGFGWRESWGIYAMGMVLLIVPLALILLKGHGERHRKWEAEMTVAESQTGQHSRMKSPLREGVFKDKRFFIILPGFLSFALFSTSVFFFQGELLAEKGWDEDLFAMSFPFFAVATMLTTMASGFLIDRMGTLKVLPFIYLPFIIALIGLTIGEQPIWLPMMMCLIGMTAGSLSVASGTLWAELYGTRILGAVRSFVMSIMVLGTAVTPAIVGFLYDADVSVAATYIGFAIYMLVFGIIQIPLGYGKAARAG
ncbi:MAG: MFS transporter [Pseudomonadota bacterium]